MKWYKKSKRYKKIYIKKKKSNELNKIYKKILKAIFFFQKKKTYSDLSLVSLVIVFGISVIGVLVIWLFFFYKKNIIYICNLII